MTRDDLRAGLGPDIAQLREPLFFKDLVVFDRTPCATVGGRTFVVLPQLDLFVRYVDPNAEVRSQVRKELVIRFSARR